MQALLDPERRQHPHPPESSHTKGTGLGRQPHLWDLLCPVERAEHLLLNRGPFNNKYFSHTAGEVTTIGPFPVWLSQQEVSQGAEDLVFCGAGVLIFLNYGAGKQRGLKNTLEHHHPRGALILEK